MSKDFFEHFFLSFSFLFTASVNKCLTAVLPSLPRLGLLIKIETNFMWSTVIFQKISFGPARQGFLGYQRKSSPLRTKKGRLQTTQLELNLKFEKFASTLSVKLTYLHNLTGYNLKSKCIISLALLFDINNDACQSILL